MSLAARFLSASVFIVLAVTQAAPLASAQMVLNRGTAGDPTTLDPQIGGVRSAAPITDDMFLTLTERDAAFNLVPGAAESWTRSDDGLTYTFRIRDGLTWSDGVPLKAQDFVFSIRRFMDPETAASFASFLYPVKNARAVNSGKLPVEEIGVAAIDDLTLEIRLERPTPFFLEVMGNPVLSPVPRHVIDVYGEEWTRPGRMVSNGAYVLAERVLSSHIKLVKNPLFYYSEQVAIDEIYYYPLRDLSASLKRFRAGELDIILNFPPNQIEWIKENLPETLHIGPALASYFLLLNLANPPLDDLRVRKAISLAIDRDAITGDLLRTGVEPAHTLVSQIFDHYEGIEVPEQRLEHKERLELARDLLSQAGYDQAKPLAIKYSYVNQEENRKIAVALQGMWQAIGVETELDDMDLRLFVKSLRTGEFSVLQYAYFVSYDDPYAFLEFLITDERLNRGHYSNSEFDALMEDAGHTFDIQKRMQFLTQAERVVMADQPVIPIYFYVWRRLIQPHVKGWVTNIGGTTPSRYLHIERD